MRHAIECVLAETLTHPAPAAFRPKPFLRNEMLTALDCTRQHLFGLTVAVETKKSQNAACTSADNVQLLISRYEVVGKQPCGNVRIFEQTIIAQIFGSQRQGVDNRAQSGSASQTQCPPHACGVSAFQILAEVCESRAREFSRGIALRN